MKKQKVTKGQIAAAVDVQTPTKRCHLCPDGGAGKPLVQVVNAVRQNSWACIQHAAFFGRERTGFNRKYLPGNDAPPVVEQPEQPANSIEVAPEAGQEEPRSKIKVRDRK